MEEEFTIFGQNTKDMETILENLNGLATRIQDFSTHLSTSTYTTSQPEDAEEQMDHGDQVGSLLSPPQGRKSTQGKRNPSSESHVSDASYMTMREPSRDEGVGAGAGVFAAQQPQPHSTPPAAAAAPESTQRLTFRPARKLGRKEEK